MNNVLTPAVATGPAAIADTQRLLGLGNLVRKDLREWLGSKRLWIVLAVSLFAFLGAASNAWINAWIRENVPAAPGDMLPPLLSLNPMDNVLIALGTQFFLIAAIFASMSLIISEREAGTLAWTISKPVSRTSVLVSKWLTATVLLWLATVVVPLAATAATVTALYGVPDLVTIVVIGTGLLVALAIFVALTIAAGVAVPSQAGVAAVGLAALLLPSLLVGIVPALEPFVPTAIVSWVVTLALGGPVTFLAPLAAVGWLALLFWVAKVRLAAMEL